MNNLYEGQLRRGRLRGGADDPPPAKERFNRHVLPECYAALYSEVRRDYIWLASYYKNAQKNGKGDFLLLKGPFPVFTNYD